MKKTILLTAICITSSIGAFAQNVNIPDANFKAYLVGNSSINTNSDTEIQVSEATAFTGPLNCLNIPISDLTGIEAFTSLTELNLFNNNLSSIDVSQNTALLYFQVADNNINNLDISQNTNLIRLVCAGNNLTSIDISNHPNLNFLVCSDNDLTSLNVANGNNTNFLVFNATGNPNLTCIEVDDVTWSETNWTNIDPTASFSLDCNATSSINDENVNIEIQIFPNPTTSQLTIQTEDKLISATIINATGCSIHVNLSSNDTVDVSNLSNGVYLLQIETEKGIAIKKFIKE